MWLLLLHFPHFSEKGKCVGKLAPCFVPENRTLLLFIVCIFPSIKPTKPKHLVLGNSYIPLTIHVFVLLWVPREIQYSSVFFFLLENYSNQEMKIFFLKVTFLFPAELYQLRQNNSRILHLKRLRDYFFKITSILWDANELRACKCPTIRKYYFCDLQFILCWVRYSFHQIFFLFASGKPETAFWDLCAENGLFQQIDSTHTPSAMLTVQVVDMSWIC